MASRPKSASTPAIAEACETVFRAAYQRLTAGDPPVSLTFPTRQEATSFRSALHTWRVKESAKNPDASRYYSLTVILEGPNASDEYTLTLRGRFNSTISAQLGKLRQELTETTAERPSEGPLPSPGPTADDIASQAEALIENLYSSFTRKEP